MYGDGELELSRDCEYAVHLSGDGDEVLSGSFKGYIMIGSDAALAMDVGGDTLYIPTAQVRYIKLLSKAPAAQRKAGPADGINYG